MRFSQLVPWEHESVGPVLSGHQLENRMMYGELCQHTRVVSHLLYTKPEYPFVTVLYLKEELCDIRHVIWTAISHGHIKQQITTVGSHAVYNKNGAKHEYKTRV